MLNHLPGDERVDVELSICVTLTVEKPLFMIGLISFCADQFGSCALFQSEIASLHVSFTAYEYFYKLFKVHRSLDGCFIQ